MQNNHGRSFGLDLARAIAISLVLIAHFAKVVEHFGFWGVELFFGLSGFLIGQILWRNFSSERAWTFPMIFNFWSRRWWRTLPNYYLFCLVMLVFHYYMGDKLPNVLQFLSVLFFSQNLWSRYENFFGVSWSLCIEEWFYLLFPFVLFLIGKINLTKRTSFIITLIFFFIASVLVRQVLIGQQVGHSLRGITFARLDAISFGVGIAFLFSEYFYSNGVKAIAFFAGLTLIIIAFYKVYFSGISYEAAKEDPILLIIIPMGFSLTLPLTAMLRAPKGIFSFLGICVEKMSLWAYSIYLSHIPILFLVYYLLQGIRTNSIGNSFSKLAGLVVTLIVSAIIYKYYELPLTKRRPREWSAGTVRSTKPSF